MRLAPLSLLCANLGHIHAHAAQHAAMHATSHKSQVPPKLPVYCLHTVFVLPDSCHMYQINMSAFMMIIACAACVLHAKSVQTTDSRYSYSEAFADSLTLQATPHCMHISVSFNNTVSSYICLNPRLAGVTYCMFSSFTYCMINAPRFTAATF